MSNEKHGIFGSIVKVLMVIIFSLIGALILTFGIIALVKYQNDYPKWVSICNIVFGACLLTSPFFLNKKREGILVIIKVLMVIIFVLIGILFLTSGIVTLVKYHDAPKYLAIMNIVFGGLLLTSPYFLKKDI